MRSLFPNLVKRIIFTSRISRIISRNASYNPKRRVDYNRAPMNPAGIVDPVSAKHVRSPTIVIFNNNFPAALRALRKQINVGRVIPSLKGRKYFVKPGDKSRLKKDKSRRRITRTFNRQRMNMVLFTKESGMG